MRFEQTKLVGVFDIHLEPIRDERGFFARSWCQKEFESHKLTAKVLQCNVSSNQRKGTLRGIHYQAAPFPETKVMRCTRGAIYAVVIDLRRESVTFKDWVGLELTPTNGRMLYVPEGCANGFLTLEDETEVSYQMSEFYRPELARGVRWNDPAFRVEWPGEITVISSRDREYPDFI
jgi:dTDP-4-dehydrorhamnose 3,5-epimerase